jgi:general nucleoside transport system ATP-binding protein
MPTLAQPPLLQLCSIHKRYPAVVANDGIDLTVRAGEIHAVLGENGAGKSTLMKIVYGAVRPDSGSLHWNGEEVSIGSPAQARQMGIGMVFQHFALFDSLTVVENIVLAMDHAPPRDELAKRILEVSHQYGLPVEPHRMVHSMSVGERQRVEIVRCLLQNPKLLIMDEPTSVLTPQAVLTLFETLRRLAAEGCSILYISHKLDEIRALCDTATVLRGGRVVGTANPKVETANSLARMMTGSAIAQCQLPPQEPKEVRLSLTNVSQATEDPFGTSLVDVSLEVRSGEILGIAGISGNGQKELMSVISGETLHTGAGAIRILNQLVGGMMPAQRRSLGFTFVPEERLGRGAVPPMSLSSNALLTGAGQQGMVTRGMMRPKAMEAFARRVIERFQVSCGGPQALASSLSGGNLQKYIVGREIELAPKVMVVSQPTWGVDIGASMMIRQALIDLRNLGVAVLVISEELDELFMMSDRLTVLNQGRLSPAVATQETNPEAIGLLMGGRPSAIY